MGRLCTGLAVGLVAAGFGAAVWHAYAITRPGYRLHQGFEALDHGDALAAAEVARGLDASGAARHAHLLRGAILVRGGQYTQALAELSEARDAPELRPRALTEAGRCFLALERPADAEGVFTLVLRENSEQVDAHRGLAAAYFDQGALQLAVQHATDWARLSPNDGRPCRFTGMIYKDLDQMQLAVPAYREALRRELTAEVRQEVREELAECLLKLGAHAEALKALEDAAPAPSRTAAVLTLRAECLRGLGKTAEAAALVEQAVASSPDFPNAQRLRGQLYLEAGEARKAAPLLENAVRLAPHDCAALFQLSQAYVKLGRVADAREQQRRMTETKGYLDELTKLTQDLMRRPRDAALHARMADLYSKIDMPALAARFERNAAALKRGP